MEMTLATADSLAQSLTAKSTGNKLSDTTFFTWWWLATLLCFFRQETLSHFFLNGVNGTAGLGENLWLTSISSSIARRLRSRNTPACLFQATRRMKPTSGTRLNPVMDHAWLELNSHNMWHMFWLMNVATLLFPDLRQKKETLYYIWAFLSFLLTHCLNSLGICQIISDYLAHLWEMPAIPLTTTHDVVIKLFIQVIKKRNGLHNHGVNLIWAELEFVAWQAKTNKHLINQLQWFRYLCVLRPWHKKNLQRHTKVHGMRPVGCKDRLINRFEDVSAD